MTLTADQIANYRRIYANTTNQTAKSHAKSKLTEAGIPLTDDGDKKPGKQKKAAKTANKTKPKRKRRTKAEMLADQKKSSTKKSIKKSSDKTDKKKGYDFIYEVGARGGSYVKSFLDLPINRGIKLNDTSATVKGLKTYNVTEVGLKQLKKEYPNNAYGDKNELSSKDLYNPQKFDGKDALEKFQQQDDYVRSILTTKERTDARKEWNKNDQKMTFEDFLLKKANEKSKNNPDKSAKNKSKNTADISTKIDNTIDKAMYFKPDQVWIKATIENILPLNKDKSSWNIEFYPVGSENKLELPMVSDSLTTAQLTDFLDGQTVKKYTIKKPTEDDVLTAWKDALAEIDQCAEEAKAERLIKRRNAKPPVKKAPGTILANKFNSLKTFAIKRAVKKMPDKSDKLLAILDRHEKELTDFFAKK